MTPSVYAVMFLVAVCNAQVASLYTATDSQTGDGTYYGYTSGGACSLDPRPSWLTGNSITVAMNAPQFANSAVCGACLSVTGSGVGSGADPITGTRTAYVNDLCPECLTGALDFGPSGDGRWSISWHAVNCPVTGSVQYRCEGSNPFYLKIQARNMPVPASMIQVVQGAKVSTLVRSGDNHFISTGSGITTPMTFPLTIRVTAISGEVFDDTIPAGSGCEGGTTVIFTGGQNRQISGFSGSVAPPPASASPTAPPPGTTDASTASPDLALRVGLGVGLGVGIPLLILAIVAIYCCCKKGGNKSKKGKNVSSASSASSDDDSSTGGSSATTATKTSQSA